MGGLVGYGYYLVRWECFGWDEVASYKVQLIKLPSLSKNSRE